MNKMVDAQKMIAGVSLIPESAPFNTEQRAWLNGFFAGMTGIEEMMAQGSGGAAGTAGVAAEPEVEEDFPWHDDALLIDERMELAAERPYERKLMAAMAQLDCGSCGYLCQTYAEAIASGDESNLTLCTPGGKETAKMVKKLVQNRWHVRRNCDCCTCSRRNWLHSQKPIFCQANQIRKTDRRGIQQRCPARRN